VLAHREEEKTREERGEERGCVRERLTNGQAERDMELRYRIVTVDLDTMACTVYNGDDPTALSITLQYIIARLPQHQYHLATNKSSLRIVIMVGHQPSAHSPRDSIIDQRFPSASSHLTPHTRTRPCTTRPKEPWLSAHGPALWRWRA
jgi:hypothetical protein